jgi:hypothetical protein
MKFAIRCVGHLVVDVGVVRRRVRLVLPSPAVVQLHPVVLPIFHLSRVFQSLGEQVSQVIVVGRILKTKVPNVGQILAEFLCTTIVSVIIDNAANIPYLDIRRTDP